MKFSFSPEKHVEPAKGKILLSEPFMDDPNFGRTVVLLCEHNENGSFGFVLNKYLEKSLSDFSPELSHDARISLGGPVHEDHLYFIHALGDEIENSFEVRDGIYIGGDFDQLQEALRSGKVEKNQIRFFKGCSGWGPDQLDNELKEKSWFVAEVESAILMDTGIQELWKTIMSSMGVKGEIIANTPKDPSLN